MSQRAGHHGNYSSYILSGRRPWVEWFAQALLDITNDPELVDEVHRLQQEARRQFLTDELGRLEDAS